MSSSPACKASTGVLLSAEGPLGSHLDNTVCRHRSVPVDWPRYTSGCGAAWLARLSGGQEVPGSNPGTPTAIARQQRDFVPLRNVGTELLGRCVAHRPTNRVGALLASSVGGSLFSGVSRRARLCQDQLLPPATGPFLPRSFTQNLTSVLSFGRLDARRNPTRVPSRPTVTDVFRRLASRRTRVGPVVRPQSVSTVRHSECDDDDRHTRRVALRCPQRHRGRGAAAAGGRRRASSPTRLVQAPSGRSPIRAGGLQAARPIHHGLQMVLARNIELPDAARAREGYGGTGTTALLPSSRPMTRQRRVVR